MSDHIDITPEQASDPDIAYQEFNHQDLKRKHKFIQVYLDKVFKNSIVFEKGLTFCKYVMVNEQINFHILLDQLYLFSQVLQTQEVRRIFRQVLLQLCERAPAMHRQQMLDYLDEETLSEVGLLNAEAFQRRKRQLNTQLNFVQSKYTMMRDENEGFAKLAVEISEASKEDDTSDARLHNIVSLIGYFDLDPDRVVDLVIESWLSAPMKASHLGILKKFKHTSVAHFLGKRFEFLLSSTGNAAQNAGAQSVQYENAYQVTITDPRVPPQNLLIVTALSIKYKLFDISLLWDYLNPSDQAMERAFAEKCDAAQRYFKKFDQLLSVTELNDQENRAERMRKEVFEQYPYNQKIWILYGLLAVNCYEHFKLLYYTIGANIDMCNFIPIKNTFGELINWAIQPLYDQICHSRHFKNRTRPQPKYFPYDPNAPGRQIPQFNTLNEEFIEWIEEILHIYSPYIAENSALYTKLFRILTEIPHQIQQERIEQLIMIVFMPALPSKDSLPIVKLFWKYAQNIDYRKRYAYYSDWKDTQQFNSLNQIVRTADLVKSSLRGVFNKLDKDNKEKMMFRLAKITHNQPMVVMNELRRDRLQNSDNNPFMVHALGLMTGFSLDILTFSIVQWLNDFQDEKKVRSQNIECNNWYKNIAYFIGAFYRKYYQVDMQGLFAHICEGLASTQEIKPELLVLKELIEKMTGIVQIEDLSNDQVQALAGGRYIQLETTYQTNDYKKSRKSNQALENFFWNTTISSCRILNQNNEEEEVSLAFLLFILLSQQRTKFLKQYNDQNLRPLSVVYDNFTWSINQLTKCLLFQTDKPTHYAQLFPKNPLHRLVIDFKIPFEVAFRIVRYGHKSLYNLSELEFQEIRDNIKQIFDHIDPMVMYENPEDTRSLPRVAHSLVKEKLWDNINPDLFAVFWLLSVDNIYVPQQVYEKQLKAQQENMLKITDPKELARFQKTSAKAMDKLQQELDNNKKRKEQFDKFLVDKKDCFKLKDGDIEQFNLVLSQLCILPRILIDPSEAMYCAKFVHTLIRISKSKYTNTFYIPRDIIYYCLGFLQCATEQESVNLSIFMVLLLQPFANWNDETKYKQDFKNYFDGFDEPQGKPQVFEKQKSFIVQTIFQRICQFIKLLKNNDTQVRNALIFLKNSQDIFPPTQHIAKELKEYLNEVSELYSDVQDIKVRIQTYRLTERIPLLPDYGGGKQQQQIQQPQTQTQPVKQLTTTPVQETHRSEKPERDRERDKDSKDRNEPERKKKVHKEDKGDHYNQGTRKLAKK